MDGQDFSRISADAALKQLSSSKKGLTPAEAAKRLKKSGAVTLQHSRQLWLQAIVRQNLHDVFFWILAVAMVAAIYLGGAHTMLALGVTLVANIWANTAFMRRSQRFLVHLERRLQAPATITRGGRQLQVEASELVVGDIVHVSQGEAVPADLRLLATSHLVMDELNLSGESKHVSKAAKIGDQNVALFGTTVLAGSGHGVVIALGRDTALGQRVGSVEKVRTLTFSPIEQQLQTVRRRVGQLAALLTLLLIVLALATGLTWHDFLSYMIVLAVAIVPVGLAPVLARWRGDPLAAPVMRSAFTDVSAKTLLVCTTIIAQVTFQLPLGITPVQLVALDVLVLLLPMLALGADDDIRPHPSNQAFSFGLLAAGLSYLNFLFFFWRLGISPVHLDNQSTLYFKAVTITFVTLALCQLFNVLFVRSDDRESVFTSYLFENKKLLSALAVSFIVILVILYVPAVRPYFSTGPLSIANWLTAVAATLIYFGARLLQRHTRKHSRRSVLELHKNLHQSNPTT
jgi:magnesium-transporting ATPase (P-type)